MKKTLLITLLSLFTFSLSAQEKAVLLSASATSSSANSSPITCLLDPSCKGSWSPGSKDNGSEEGLYFQFEKAIQMDTIKIQFPSATSASATRLRLSINGKNINQKFITISESSFDFNFNEKDIKSIFIKIEENDSEEVSPKPQFLKIELYKEGQKINLQIPRLVAGAVFATSILEPQIAYHPSHLFDAKNDFAWATNGKKNDGVGESFSLKFNTTQNIAGLMIWNGYQRSPLHFKSNGRVLEAEVMGDKQKEDITIQNISGMQKILFKTPLLNSSAFHFKIKKIQAGEKYKDVLLSELRFINTQGEIVLPQVEGLKTQASASLQTLLDQSYASFLHQPVFYKLEAGLSAPSCSMYDIAPSTYFYQRIRLRSDGSFVIYKWEDQCKRDSEYKPFRLSANVLEGNWEELPNGNLRLFGKKYPNTLEGSEYLKEKDRSVEATIFQTELKIKRYNDFNASERKTLLSKLWKIKNGPASFSQPALWCETSKTLEGTDPKYSKNFISGGGVHSKSLEELMAAMDSRLRLLNPVSLSSSVLDDLFLPSIDTNSSSRECRP